MSTGQRMAETFLGGDVGIVWHTATPDMRLAIGPVSNLATFRDRLLADFGTEEAVLSEHIERQAGHTVFIRLSRWTGGAEPLELVIVFDSTERIAGFTIRPKPVAAQSPYLDYRTQANLRLPFSGEWHVCWGGRNIEDNYHATDLGQRFALDMLILRGGQSHAGDPSSLASYHCWGQPVLAPADGVIVRAVDGLPDQAIGTADTEHPAGNHAVIDLGNDEYVFLAHFQQNSVRVIKGDHVASGQEIGRCGNSGNTSEPHLHFHLQTNPDLGRGQGLPAQFTNYVADGMRIDRGEPAKGESIRPAD
jgi:hypothetical protein